MRRITQGNFRKDKYYAPVAAAFGAILKRSEVVATIDILVEMGRLTRQNVEDWRFGRIPYLERVFIGNLEKAARMLRIIHLYAAAAKLRPSPTVYCRWGKHGKRAQLRFTRFGHAHMEQAYATHFLRSPKSSHKPPTAAPSAADSDVNTRHDVPAEAADTNLLEGPRPRGPQQSADATG
jgi:hypothetical protein